jgi:L-threonylcarbamoyladenylate synthase
MMNYKKDIESCLEVLHNGGLILYPTDTIWGLGCDATNEMAIQKIFNLKQRSEEKSMIILLAEESEISTYTQQKSIKVYDYIKGLNKPVTVIYNLAVNLPPNLINNDGSIGIRLVQDDFCQSLIKEFGKPIVSTSANISGYPAPTLFSDIDVLIKNGVDYVVEHRQEEQHASQPSAIVKIEENGTVTIIRH